MAPSNFNVPIAMALFIIIVFHQPYTVYSDFLSPLLSPIFDNVCKEVPCGKGSCRPTQNIMLPFECVCEPGWKQPFSANGFQFLPCVIPNCTINASCSATAAPTPTPAPAPKNATSGNFDLCSWNFCGSGTCSRSSNSSYSCSCSEGYDNLMNSSSLPCFRECELGGDCKNLGFTLFNHTAQAPTVNPIDSTNEASSLERKNFAWVATVFVMLAPTIGFV